MYIDLDTIETAVVLSRPGALCCTRLQLNGRTCLCILKDTLGFLVLALVTGQVSGCSLVSACGCRASGVVPLVISSLTPSSPPCSSILFCSSNRAALGPLAMTSAGSYLLKVKVQPSWNCVYKGRVKI